MGREGGEGSAVGPYRNPWGAMELEEPLRDPVGSIRSYRALWGWVGGCGGAGGGSYRIQQDPMGS